MKFTYGVQQYVLRKHTEGIAFETGEKYLTSLGRYLGDAHLGQVKSQQILTFLDDSLANATTWRLKYFVVQRFFDFWAARGVVTEMLMPPIRPKERQGFLPHVYSQAELKILLKATATNEKSKLCIPSRTMRVFIILLYGTGARIGELLSLSVEDVDLERSSIRITNINPNRCRQIPMCADLCQVLQKLLYEQHFTFFHPEKHFVLFRHVRRPSIRSITTASIGHASPSERRECHRTLTSSRGGYQKGTVYPSGKKVKMQYGK